MNFLKRLWRKLFGPPPKILDYDTTQVRKTVRTPDGEKEVDAGLTEAGEKARKEILRTELHEGDQYRLGPNAMVTVGPPGKAGKAWITKRVKANTEKRRKHFEKWWAEKRKRCIEIMLMSEAELKATGIYDEVQKFLAENREFIEYAESLGLMKKPAISETKLEVAPPSGHPEERTALVFDKILESSGLKQEAVPELAWSPPEFTEEQKAEFHRMYLETLKAKGE